MYVKEILATKGIELEEFSLLEVAADKKHLTIQDGKTAPKEAVRDEPDNDYDAPF